MTVSAGCALCVCLLHFSTYDRTAWSHTAKLTVPGEQAINTSIIMTHEGWQRQQHRAGHAVD